MSQPDPEITARIDHLLRTDARLLAAAPLLGRVPAIVGEPKPARKPKARKARKLAPPRVGAQVPGEDALRSGCRLAPRARRTPAMFKIATIALALLAACDAATPAPTAQSIAAPLAAATVPSRLFCGRASSTSSAPNRKQRDVQRAMGRGWDAGRVRRAIAELEDRVSPCRPHRP